MKEKNIVIDVWRGCVTEVRNLPKGWTYEIIDHDVNDEQKEGHYLVDE